MAQTSKIDTSTEIKATEASKAAATVDPDAALKADLRKRLEGALPEAVIARMIADAVRAAQAVRDEEAIIARRAERNVAARKLLSSDQVKAMVAFLEASYDTDGEEQIVIRRSKDNKGDFTGKLTMEVISTVGVRKATGGSGVARSGERWRVSGPGINETLGSPSTAAQKVQEVVTGKSSATNGRDWWGIPQEAPVGHKVAKTYKDSIFTIERIG